MELFLSICLGIGLSAATGFRIFVPALIANAAILSGWITPGSDFQWLGTWTAFAILTTATAAEIAAYYVPVIDNLLDTIATPASVVAGTLLTTSFVQIDNPVLQWGLGLIVGGGTAGVVQAGTGVIRLLSTKFTAGVANPVVSTTENVASFGFSTLAILLPLFTAVLVFFFVMWIIRRLVRLKKTT